MCESNRTTVALFFNVLTRKPLNLWTSSLPLSLYCLYSQAWGVAWSKDTDVPSCKNLFSRHLIFRCMGLELAKQQRRADGNEFCQIKHNLLDTICNVSWSLYSVELLLFFHVYQLWFILCCLALLIMYHFCLPILWSKAFHMNSWFFFTSRPWNANRNIIIQILLHSGYYLRLRLSPGYYYYLSAVIIGITWVDEAKTSISTSAINVHEKTVYIPMLAWSESL